MQDLTFKMHFQERFLKLASNTSITPLGAQGPSRPVAIKLSFTRHSSLAPWSWYVIHQVFKEQYGYPRTMPRQFRKALLHGLSVIKGVVVNQVLWSVLAWYHIIAQISPPGNFELVYAYAWCMLYHIFICQANPLPHPYDPQVDTHIICINNAQAQASLIVHGELILMFSIRVILNCDVISEHSSSHYFVFSILVWTLAHLR